MRVIQREFNDGIGYLLGSPILMIVVGADLAFQGLKTALFDPFPVPVYGVTRDPADTGSFTDVSQLFGQLQDLQFLLNGQIDHGRSGRLNDFGYCQMSAGKIDGEPIAMACTDFYFLVCDGMLQRRLNEVELVGVAERMIIAYSAVILNDADIV